MGPAAADGPRRGERGPGQEVDLDLNLVPVERRSEDHDLVPVVRRHRGQAEMRIEERGMRRVVGVVVGRPDRPQRGPIRTGQLEQIPLVVAERKSCVPQLGAAARRERLRSVDPRTRCCWGRRRGGTGARAPSPSAQGSDRGGRRDLVIRRIGRDRGDRADGRLERGPVEQPGEGQRDARSGRDVEHETAGVGDPRDAVAPRPDRPRRIQRALGGVGLGRLPGGRRATPANGGDSK